MAGFDGWLWLPDSVLLEPVEEGCGERGVGATVLAEESAGVDQSFRCDLVARGPVVPDVERVDGHFGCCEATVEMIEFLGELSLRFGVLAESGVFGAELVALVEEWLGAAGELVERRLRGRDFVRGERDFVAGSASVEPAAFGEVVFGLSVLLPGCVEIGGDGGDRSVVWRTLRREFVELGGQLVDVLLESHVVLMFGFVSCVGGGEFLGGSLVDIGEPVRNRTSRLQDGCWRDGGGEVAAHAGGGQVGAIGCEDLFEHVDRVADLMTIRGDEHEVLDLASGDRDVQPATSRGWL